MRYWEYLLTVEKNQGCDLSLPKWGTAFLRAAAVSSLRHRLKRQAEAGDTWAADHVADPRIDLAGNKFAPLEGEPAEEWATGVKAIRSVSARLEGFKTLPAEIADGVADSILAKYVQRLTPVVVVRARYSDKNKPIISKKTPASVRMCPTARAKISGKEEREEFISAISVDESGLCPIASVDSTVPTRADWDSLQLVDFSHVATVVDLTLQRAFASLVVDPLNPVCAKCGCDLGLTPKARTPRAGMCKPCRNKDWHDRQPKEKLREQWRARKAAERSQTREGA